MGLTTVQRDCAACDYLRVVSGVYDRLTLQYAQHIAQVTHQITTDYNVMTKVRYNAYDC